MSIVLDKVWYGAELSPRIIERILVAIHDLATKVRGDLVSGYLLDLYYNPTLVKYTYALIHQGRRIYRWDNAPHHPGLANYPHHFHAEDSSIQHSAFAGDPEQDVRAVIAQVNARLQER
jgi:hypothetical protein